MDSLTKDDKSLEGARSSVDELSNFDKEEIALAMALSSAEEDERRKRVIETESLLEEDEQLAKALQKSMDVESPPQSPQYDNGSSFPTYSGSRVCAGCNTEIDHIESTGLVWHPECFRCHACNEPISENEELSLSDNHPYHKSCWKNLYHPRCDVCKEFFPMSGDGHVTCIQHPFWPQKYCPSHVHDGTPCCCSCTKMETVDARSLILEDGRKLCLECLDSSIMDTHECQSLFIEIQEFYEGLNMRMKQNIPVLLVERQALNEAREGEIESHHHMTEIRGLCLFEEQTVKTISMRPRIEDYQIINLSTEPHKLDRQCEVTAILVLYGLPRLLTGSIMAHELMHAWLKLKDFPTLSQKVEEGICQLLAHMWLDSEIVAGSGSNIASSSNSTPSSSGSSKKHTHCDFEKKLGKYFIYEIESDTSVDYGEGFKKANKAMLDYGLKRTLDHIWYTGDFP